MANVPITTVVDMSTRKPYIDPSNVPLDDQAEFGGGGGGGAPVDPSTTMKDYVDARDEAVESRLGAKLDKIPSTATLWVAAAAIVGSIFTGVAIILATLAFGSDRFNGGLSASPAISAAQSNQALVDADQNTKIKLMDDKLDVIIRQTASKKEDGR